MVDLPTLTKTEFLYLNLGFSSKNHNYLKKACTQITKPIEHRYEIQVGKYTPSTMPTEILRNLLSQNLLWLSPKLKSQQKRKQRKFAYAFNDNDINWQKI